MFKNIKIEVKETIRNRRKLTDAENIINKIRIAYIDNNETDNEKYEMTRQYFGRNKIYRLDNTTNEVDDDKVVCREMSKIEYDAWWLLFKIGDGNSIVKSSGDIDCKDCILENREIYNTSNCIDNIRAREYAIEILKNIEIISVELE